MLPPTAFGPPCLMAAAFAAAKISAALKSPGTKGLLPLTLEAAAEASAGEAAGLVEPLDEAAAAAAPLPSRWSLLGTISNLPSGCREPCLVLLIFILRSVFLSLAEAGEVAEALWRPPLEVKVVVSVSVCVAEPTLLLLQLVVTNVFNLEAEPEAMPPTEDEGPVAEMGVIDEETTVAVEGLPPPCEATCEVVEEAMEAEGETVDMADLLMSSSKSMMRLPTSTSGQLSLSSNSKLSVGAGVLCLAFLTGLLRLWGVAAAVLLLPLGVTLAGTSSCIWRDVRPQHHGAQGYALAHMKSLTR